MSTVQRSEPASDSGVKPANPNPYRFRTSRVILLVEGAVLFVLGGWGLLADLRTPHPGPTGVPVLVLQFTTTHSVLFLVTGLLALIAAWSRPAALILTGAQFMGYLLVFAIGSVAYARGVSSPLGLDVADLASYLVLTALGAAQFMWLSGQGLEGRWWVWDRRSRAAGPQAPRQSVARPPSERHTRPASARNSRQLATGNLERFGPGLQDDSRLYLVKLLAGALSIIALVAMFVTSLIRAPAPAVDTVLAALALVLIVAISSRIIRTHSPRD